MFSEPARIRACTSLGKQDPPYPGPGNRNAWPMRRHVRPDGLAQLRDLIHEGDPRGEHGVGGVLGHLGRGNVHHDQWIAGAHKGGVELFDHFGRFGRVDPYHDAVGLHEVIDGGAFLEELRIRAHVKRRRRFARDLRAHLRGRAHRDGALRDDDLGRVHVLADRRGDGEHVLQVGRSVFVGRRPHGDEHDLGALDGGADVGREGQPALTLIADDERLESGLVDREFVRLEVLDLGRIDVGTYDVIARLRETGTHDQTYISGADDGDLHARGPALGNTCRVSTTERACRAINL